MARGECTVCGVTFPLEDLVDVDNAPRCPRCFALTSTGTQERGSSAGGGTRSEDERARTAFTPESLEAIAAGPDPREPAPEPDRPATEDEDPGGRFHPVVASIREWAAGRNWWIRAPVLLWMVWILVHYWSAPWYSTLFQGIDLAIHEIGHILWSPLGEFMGFAGGTLTQLLVPVAAGLALYHRERDWFGVAIAVCWLGINCFEIVEYAGDALARQLPLVSPTTGSPQHDWTYLLSELGILRHTDAVAAAWQWAGRVIMTTGVAFGGWLLWVMARSSEPEGAG